MQICETRQSEHNHYLKTYEAYYKVNETGLDLKAMETLLTNFFHVQDLFDQCIHDFILMTGKAMKTVKEAKKEQKTERVTIEGKVKRKGTMVVDQMEQEIKNLRNVTKDQTEQKEPLSNLMALATKRSKCVKRTDPFLLELFKKEEERQDKEQGFNRFIEKTANPTEKQSFTSSNKQINSCWLCQQVS